MKTAGQGVGASILRREDTRFLHGAGRYVADLDLPRMLDVAFVRSPMAHARIAGFEIDPDVRDVVFTAADMDAVQPIVPPSRLPGHRIPPYPAMADGKALFVGQILAACVAGNRACAEDIAETVVPDLEPLPVVSSTGAALAAGAPLVHEDWGTNLSAETLFDSGIDAAVASASVHVSRHLDMARQAMVPLEGKGVVAEWDHRLDQLVVHSSTQSPHLIRNALSTCLGLEQRRIRVIAPDVGGGFGFKAILQAEEVIVCWLAMRLRRPVRWLEDRFEHLTASANAREHSYRIDVHADGRGRILALDAELTTDAGAFSIWPHTNAFDAIQASGILPGPYRIPHYRIRTLTVATNKPPLAPYRAVARPSACFAMEMIMDALAREVGRDPADVRLENLVPADAMPYAAVTGKIYDTGDYPACLQRARAMIEASTEDGPPSRWPRRIGIGYSMYTEHTAVSTATIAPLGIEMLPGYELAALRLAPDGGLEIRVGVQSHGQGMETTLAQIVNEVLGIALERISVIHGDTGLTPYSTGTYASRSAVMTGGAVADACDRLARRLQAIGAHLLQASPEEIEVGNGQIAGPVGSLTIEAAARTWHFQPHELTDTLLADALEVTGAYRPDGDGSPFAYAAHAAKVAVDPELGTIELLDYVVVDDCGVRVNPMIVDGQVLGGAVQGIGTALYEECPFDEDGQPLHTTFGEYLVPSAAEIPLIRLDHSETPAPMTRFGVKGVGEGGAIAPPAAIANAVNAALAPLGAEVRSVPVTPRRVLAALAEATPKEVGR